MKDKKAIIVISMVKESEKNPTKKLSKSLPTIPWLESVEKITVLEE